VDETALSDAGSEVIVTDSMVSEAGAGGVAGNAAAAASLGGATPLETSGTRAQLQAMGFHDAGMIETAIAKHGEADVGACARDLAAAAEWDPLLDDLAEMGFTNRELNKSLMLKHSGNLKRTVKELVEEIEAP